MNIDQDFKLDINCQCRHLRNHVATFSILFTILIVVYGNSFNCSWHHDDYDNIVNNKHIQIKELSSNEVNSSLFGFAPHGTWFRPFSYFTFAINYFFCGTDVFGYHIVNYFIHYLASIFLFLLIYNTLQLPLLKDRYGKCAYSVALLSTVLWSIHPIQVTSVTYIVQRMASLVSMFYILAMYLYLKGRMERNIRKAVIFYCMCTMSFVLALGTKENAAMLPVALVIYDLYFIQGINRRNVLRMARILTIPALLGLVVLLIYIMHETSSIDYSNRIFGMRERVLTQPRVFLFYISLLLYPLTSRFMLIHFVDVSTSLFHPWITAAAIGAVIGIFTFAILEAKKRPLLSFCIIFFYLNHLIEGSFLSLELIYEHRNYLPSMFFFVPISIGLLNALDFFVERKGVFMIIGGAITSVIVIWGVTVVMQNQIYRDEISLWSDNVSKMPNLHTPHHNLGNAYMTAGRLPEAFSEFQKALQSVPSESISNKYMTYTSLARYYFLINDRDKLLYYTNKVLHHFPRRADYYNAKAALLFDRNEITEAEKAVRKAISLEPETSNYYSNLGIILLKKEGFEKDTVKAAQESLRRNPDSWQGYFILSEVHKMRGNKDAANHFYRIGQKIQLPK